MLPSHLKQSMLMKRAMSVEVEMEYNSLQPFFYGAEDEEKNFYDSSLAFPDCWKKFELRTCSSPPQPKIEDDEQVYSNLNTDMSVDSNVDISYILKRIRTESLSQKANDNMILKDDIMWSAGLERSAAGTKVKTPEKHVKTITEIDAARATPTSCVDPSQMFIPVNNSEFTSSKCDDIDDSDSSDHEVCDDSNDDEETDDEIEDDDDDDEEEVDVVSLNKSQQEVRLQSALRNAVYGQNNLPPSSAAVITADVAVMHNYSNRSSTGGQPATCASPEKPVCVKRPVSERAASLLVKRQKLSETSSVVTRPRHRITSTASGLRHTGRIPTGCQRREMHNVLERKRRDDLRGSFNGLRDLLPNIHAKERVPKVTILRKSCEYIRSLRRSFHELSQEMTRQKQRHGDLRAKLKELGMDGNCAHWG